MAMNFTETVGFVLPDVKDELAAFRESFMGPNAQKGLIVEIASIHEGLTANFNYYTAQALEEAVETWVKPYPKPIIMNHDMTSEPIGRVITAKYDQEADGTPYIRLQVAITDPVAIEKVSDGRYLTGSVGGRVESAVCNICGTDWAKSESGPFELPCNHRRGRTYKEKVAFLEMREVSFKEYSIVNAPADERSGVRTVGVQQTFESSESSDTARVYSIDMEEKAVYEFSESDTAQLVSDLSLYESLEGAFIASKENNDSHITYADVGYLSDGKKRLPLDTAERAEDAWEAVNLESFAERYTPRQLKRMKSRIKSALKAFGVQGIYDKEFTMSNQDVEEDILAVSEKLSADLAEEASSVEEEILEDESSTSESEDDTQPEEEATEDVAEADEESEEGDEESEEEDTENDSEEVEDESESDTRDQSENESESTSEETDSEESTVSKLESRLEELEAENAKLTDRIQRLESALKRNLAERVVDTKIALGVLAPDSREEQVNEHIGRTASSLADSLRDLQTFETVKPALTMPEALEEAGVAVKDPNAVVEEDNDDSNIDLDDQNKQAEEYFYKLLNSIK